MPSYYLKDTFFNTFHRFEDKKLRDSLVGGGKYPFLQALSSDELSNAEKRSASAWTINHDQRANAALAVSTNFGTIIESVRYAADHDHGPSRDFIERTSFYSQGGSSGEYKASDFGADVKADANDATKT